MEYNTVLLALLFLGQFGIGWSQGPDVLIMEVDDDASSNASIPDPPDVVLGQRRKQYKADVDVGSEFSIGSSGEDSDFQPKARFMVSAGSGFMLQCPEFLVPCESHMLRMKVKGGLRYEFCSSNSSTEGPESRTFSTVAEVQTNTKISIEIDGPLDGDFSLACYVRGFEVEEANHQKNSASCGLNRYASNRRDDKIVGGNNVARDKHPWMVVLTYNRRFTCGGTVISNNWVITAAHCVLNSANRPLSRSAFTLYFGCTSFDDCTASRTVSRILWHQFGSVVNGNDVAYMRVSSSLPRFNSQINSVCIPSTTPRINSVVTAVGWGRTQNGGISRWLKEATMTVVSRNVCGARNNGVFCTNYRSGSSCNGDSGGPLGVFINNRFFQYGITSYGPSSCRSTAGNSNVAYYRGTINWILTQ